MRATRKKVTPIWGNSRNSGWLYAKVPPLLLIHTNQVWCADFKGQLPTQDGKGCYPLTATGAHSRFLLCCHGLSSVRQEGVLPVFERLFEEYGLPKAIRTDNRVPFAT